MFFIFLRSLRQKILLFSIILLGPTFTFAQLAETATSSIKEEKSLYSGNAQLAMSSKDYVVTAGDTYALSFYASGTAVSYTITIDPTYKIRVANLGSINCAGMSFVQLKQNIENLVMQNYPLSVVTFVMLQPSSFKVVICGETGTVHEQNAWSLNRLSDILGAAQLTPYSSLRNIKITGSNGKTKQCDLFKASRFGDFSQNPYLRPGDRIEFSRFDRKVSISGAVEREGTYDILKDENLSELIYSYAGKPTKTADLTRIQLLRLQNNGDRLTEISFLTEKEIKENFKLYDGDSIYIPSTGDLTPFIEITGVFGNESSSAYDPNRYTVNRTRVNFYQNEKYSSLIRRIHGSFSVFSDLEKIYITRNGQEILINADKIMDDLNYESPYFVQKGDELIIPYRPLFNANQSGLDYSAE